MDAYSSYIMSITDARVGELRREAAEYAVSRAARLRRPSLRARIRARFGPGQGAAPGPVVALPLPAADADVPLRHSA